MGSVSLAYRRTYRLPPVTAGAKGFNFELTGGRTWRLRP